MLNAANELLDELQADGRLDEIIKSFFDGTSTFAYENPVADLPTDKQTYLVVATNAEFPPFEYTSGNKYVGIDIEIAKLLADKLGKVLYVYDMSFDAVIQTVQSGIESNIGMAGITVNEDRKKQVDFTDEYYQSDQVLVTTQSDTTFADCQSVQDILDRLAQQDKNFVVGTQSGTTGYMFANGNEGFGYEGFDNLTTNGYTAGALAVKDLANGKINAVIIDKQPVLMIADTINKQSEGVFQIFYEQFVTLEGYKAVLDGLLSTVEIAVIGLLIGFVIGSVLAVFKLLPNQSWYKSILSGFANIYVAIFRGTPMVVQLLIMHFALFPLLGINISSVMEAALVFGLNSGAYTSEIMRGGIMSVDKGQMEAGRALGLGFTKTMVKIIIPQAVKNVVPTLGNEFISLIKETSVVSFIAVVDLTKAFQNIANSTYEYFVPYIVLALFYFVIVLFIASLIKLVERRLRKSDRR